MRRLACLLVTAASVAAASPAMAEASPPLSPFQLVRSLQLVQDRLADGDHAALPMQKKLLEMIDRRLREASAEEFEDLRNFRAMLIYAMSGGNPATIEVVSAKLHLEGTDAALSRGVLEYLQGRPSAARTQLAGIDALAQAPELGAFLALVKGSIAVTDDPQAALRFFDQARLLGPGTLIEEAALRRSIILSAERGDAGRFLLLSSQYVRRFLRSPYASQFADSFVAGVIQLHGIVSLDAVDDIVAGMDADQRKVIYLRLARRSAIDGLRELSAFASTRAEKSGSSEKPTEDPRAVLYASLSSVTSDNVAEVVARLKTIDTGKLSANDRLLLEAVTKVASEVMAALPEPEQPKPETSVREVAPAPSDAIAEAEAEADLPDIVPVADEPPVAEVESGPKREYPAAQPAATASQATQDTATSDPATEAAALTAADARRKLELVDELLKATTQ